MQAVRPGADVEFKTWFSPDFQTMPCIHLLLWTEVHSWWLCSWMILTTCHHSLRINGDVFPRALKWETKYNVRPFNPFWHHVTVSTYLQQHLLVTWQKLLCIFLPSESLFLPQMDWSYNLTSILKSVFNYRLAPSDLLTMTPLVSGYWR